MSKVETAEEFVSRLERLYNEQEEERGDKFTEEDARTQLVLHLEQRDSVVQVAELARVVKRLRDEAARGRELQRENACDGPLYARWKWHADSCGFAADLLEREGPGV